MGTERTHFCCFMCYLVQKCGLLNPGFPKACLKKGFGCRMWDGRHGIWDLRYGLWDMRKTRAKPSHLSSKTWGDEKGFFEAVRYTPQIWVRFLMSQLWERLLAAMIAAKVFLKSQTHTD